jgi:hypothetical protein
MTKDDILSMASESYCWRINLSNDRTASLARLQRFAELVAATEREACASIEVHLTTPDRDYTTMSPLDAYEAALMDAAMAFREAIRARGEHGSN